jgi:hypothetical protein
MIGKRISEWLGDPRKLTHREPEAGSRIVRKSERQRPPPWTRLKSLSTSLANLPRMIRAIVRREAPSAQVIALDYLNS